MTEEKQDNIMQTLGEVRTDVKELVRRVGIQNGRVTKSEEEINTLKVKYQNIQDNNEFIVKMVDASYQKLNKFLDNQEMKEEKKKDWVGVIKQNIIIFSITCLIGILLGNYAPLVWLYVRKRLIG